MVCQHCQSPNVLKCKVAYEQGTSTGTIQTPGGNEMDRTVKTSTEFAKRAAPPSSGIKASLGWTALWAVVVALASVGGTEMNGFVYFGVVMALLGAGALVWFVKALPSYNAKLAEWERSWICRACGERFLPN